MLRQVVSIIGCLISPVAGGPVFSPLLPSSPVVLVLLAAASSALTSLANGLCALPGCVVKSGKKKSKKSPPCCVNLESILQKLSYDVNAVGRALTGLSVTCASCALPQQLSAPCGCR